MDSFLIWSGVFYVLLIGMVSMALWPLAQKLYVRWKSWKEWDVIRRNFFE